MLEKAEDLIQKEGVPFRSIIKVSHRISQGIVDTAIEEQCNFIVTGRQKQPTFLDRVFSSSIDTVLQKASSEVAVLHGELHEKNKIKKILIPFNGDIHTRLATEMAPAITQYFNAELHIVIVFPPQLESEVRNKKLEEIKKVIDENSLNAKVDEVIDKDILGGIMRKTKNVDLLMMGGRTGDFLELLLGKSLVQEITGKVKCPVLWVKEFEERPSFWASLLQPYKKAGVEK